MSASKWTLSYQCCAVVTKCTAWLGPRQEQISKSQLGQSVASLLHCTKPCSRCRVLSHARPCSPKAMTLVTAWTGMCSSCRGCLPAGQGTGRMRLPTWGSPPYS
eukprot:356902-Chlamydomonas_euryale.AAC.16